MKRTETVKVLQELGWETLKSRRTKAKLILLYKIKNNLVSSSYLLNSIPSEEVVVRQYNFRSIVPSIPNVYSRLKTRESSFFPATITLWNKLPDVLKTSYSVTVFKRKLAVHFNSLPCQDLLSNFSLFSFGFYGRILTQIRLGPSPLNLHLFTYSIIETQMCPNCLVNVESTQHYFLDCVHYNDIRAVLLSNITKILIQFNIKIDCVYPRDRDLILRAIVHGFGRDVSLSSEINELIYANVVIFISSSKRFVKRSIWVFNEL